MVHVSLSYPPATIVSQRSTHWWCTLHDHQKGVGAL